MSAMGWNAKLAPKSLNGSAHARADAMRSRDLRAPAARAEGHQEFLRTARIDALQTGRAAEEIVLAYQLPSIATRDGGEAHAPVTEAALRDGLADDLRDAVVARVARDRVIGFGHRGLAAFEHLEEAAFDE